ncbi:MAG: asparaginase [Anaeroplasmataceae bacterium]
MKNILLITTGGTISSVESSHGLKPANNYDSLLSILKTNDTIITCKSIMVLDSSNIQPEEWKIIATEIYNEMKNYDGIIVTHGTDTMAYTASMMCFMVQNPNIPIVFTGSQLPITHPLTDAIDNLRLALAMAKTNYHGIFIAFDRKIILGCRAVKVRTSGFSAFESINLKKAGFSSAAGLTINEELLAPYTDEPKLNTNIETNVFLLKLTPTTNPEIIDLLLNFGIKGIVIEAYGAGGISFVRRDFVSKLKKAIDSNVPVVVASQCLYEKSNFQIYEVGSKVIETGAIEAIDMTTEAAVCKLMYALGQTNDLKEVKKIFNTPIAREINIK